MRTPKHAPAPELTVPADKYVKLVGYGHADGGGAEMRAAGGGEDQAEGSPATSATGDEAMEWRRLLHSVVTV